MALGAQRKRERRRLRRQVGAKQFGRAAVSWYVPPLPGSRAHPPRGLLPLGTTRVTRLGMLSSARIRPSVVVSFSLCVCMFCASWQQSKLRCCGPLPRQPDRS